MTLSVVSSTRPRHMPKANRRGGDWIFLLVSANSSHVFGYSSLARWAWLLPTSHHGDVVTAAATPVAFSTCRRVIRAMVDPPLTLHRTEREPLDHPPLEDQVEHQGRQRAQERGAHHRPPEEDVLD